MILTDKTIKEKLKHKEITITPQPTFEQIQPSSIDLRLGKEYLLPIIDSPIDPKNNTPRYEQVECNILQLPPRGFVLGTTIEEITLPPNLIGRVEGRSSIGRLGITIHVTAGFIDPSFKGQITLEIANLSNNTVYLYHGQRICQIIFEELDITPNRVYGECGNKYQGQKGVTGSLIHYDDDTDKYGEI